MLVKFLHLAVAVCIATSSLLAAPAKDTRSRKKTRAKTKPATTEVEDMTPFQYVAGGALSVLPGFGLGHVVQGRWLNDYGWVFTAGQVVSLMGIANSLESCISTATVYHGTPPPPTYRSDPDHCDSDKQKRKKVLGISSSIAFVAFKIGEVAHALWPARLAPLQRGKTVNPDAIPIPRQHYLWGAALGTAVGFGLGHAVQGRWWTQGRGWAYTLTQLPVFVALYSLMEYDKCEERAYKKSEEEEGRWGCPEPLGEGTAGVLLAMYVVSRIVEIFNVWDIDYNLHRIADKSKRKSLLLLPYASTQGFGLQLAFSH